MATSVICLRVAGWIICSGLFIWGEGATQSAEFERAKAVVVECQAVCLIMRMTHLNVG